MDLTQTFYVQAGELIRLARKRARMDQKELAWRLHIDPSACGRYERGKVPMKAELVCAAADALGCELKMLIPTTYLRTVLVPGSLVPVHI